MNADFPAACRPGPADIVTDGAVDIGRGIVCMVAAAGANVVVAHNGSGPPARGWPGSPGSPR